MQSFTLMQRTLSTALASCSIPCRQVLPPSKLVQTVYPAATQIRSPSRHDTLKRLVVPSFRCVQRTPLSLLTKIVPPAPAATQALTLEQLILSSVWLVPDARLVEVQSPAGCGMLASASVSDARTGCERACTIRPANRRTTMDAVLDSLRYFILLPTF